MWNKKYVGLFCYGGLLSSLIAVVSFVFLAVEGKLAAFIWEEMPLYFQNRIISLLIICLLGSILVGSIRKKWSGVPQTAHEIVSEFKKNKTLDYRLTFHSMVAALIILSFGAGVGPEATLLGSVISLSILQGDKMRYYYFNYQELSNLKSYQKYLRMLTPFNYHLTYDESRQISNNEKRTKKILLLLLIVNGLVTFTILMRKSGQPSFISKLGQSAWKLEDLKLVLPIIIFAFLYNYLYQIIDQLIQKLLVPLRHSQMLQALIGGLAIFLIALYFPKLLFSGQQTMETIANQGTMGTFLKLSSLSLIKLVFLLVCLNTGWIGGNIFPVFLGGVLQGYGIAALLPSYDSLFIVAVVSTCLSLVIIDSPLIVGIFIALFFPLNLVPVIASLVIAYYLIKKFRLGRTSKGIIK